MNVSATEEFPVFTSLEVLGSASLGSICLLGCALNSLLMFTVYTRQKTAKRPINYFLLSLFLTDGLLGITNGPVFLSNAHAHTWQGGSASCHFISITSVLFCAQSVFTLAAIALERYWIIVREHSKFPHKGVIAILLATWCCSFLLSALSWFDSSHFPYGMTNVHYFCVGRWSATGVGKVYPVLAIFILFVALSFTALAYYKIYKKTVLQSQVKDYLGSAAHQRRKREDSDLAWKMSMLVCLFIFDWMWYLITMLQEAITEQQVSAQWDGFSTIMGYTNSLVNPLLYLLMDSRYRWGRCCGQSELTVEAEVSGKTVRRAASGGLSVPGSPRPIPVSHRPGAMDVAVVTTTTTTTTTTIRVPSLDSQKHHHQRTKSRVKIAPLGSLTVPLPTPPAAAIEIIVHPR